MANPSGPIAIVCGYDANGVVVPVTIDADGKLVVSSGTTTVDAADVTYTPSTLSDWNGGVDPGNQNQANDQLASRVKAIEGLTVDELLAVRAHWFHDTDFVETGNNIVLTVAATQAYCAKWAQTAAANGDIFRNSCILKPGSYTISLLGSTASNQGKLDIDFKHVNDAGYTSITTAQDWYASPGVANVVKTATFTVVTAGRHIFKFTVNGKNASSSAYVIMLTKIDIFLTAGDS